MVTNNSLVENNSLMVINNSLMVTNNSLILMKNSLVENNSLMATSNRLKVSSFSFKSIDKIRCFESVGKQQHLMIYALEKLWSAFSVSNYWTILICIKRNRTEQKDNEYRIKWNKHSKCSVNSVSEQDNTNFCCTFRFLCELSKGSWT